MSIGIICCQSLALEIKTIIRDLPEVTHVKVLDWKLQNDPDLLLETAVKN